MGDLDCSVPWTHREDSFERSECFFVIQVEPVPRRLGDGNHHEVVLLTKLDEVGHACLRAVVVDYLADDACRVESRESFQSVQERHCVPEILVCCRSLLRFREVWPTLLKESRARLPDFRRTHPRGELFVLVLHGLLDLRA